MTNIHESTTRVYYALHKQMNESYRKGATDIESTREAESIAHSLIKNDDLPLLICCRALCILGCSDRGDYLFFAEESAHYAKLGIAAVASEQDGTRIGTTNATRRPMQTTKPGLLLFSQPEPRREGKRYTKQRLLQMTPKELQRLPV
jgi:hypothetical protein